MSTSGAPALDAALIGRPVYFSICSRMNRLDSRARSSQAKTQAVMIVRRVAEAEPLERREELVPVDLALADVEVLVDPGGRARAG